MAVLIWAAFKFQHVHMPLSESEIHHKVMHTYGCYFNHILWCNNNWLELCSILRLESASAVMFTIHSQNWKFSQMCAYKDCKSLLPCFHLCSGLSQVQLGCFTLLRDLVSLFKVFQTSWFPVLYLKLNLASKAYPPLFFLWSRETIETYFQVDYCISSLFKAVQA